MRPYIPLIFILACLSFALFFKPKPRQADPDDFAVTAPVKPYVQGKKPLNARRPMGKEAMFKLAKNQAPRPRLYERRAWAPARPNRAISSIR
ncbi:MAG: hypothetical protein AB7N80_07355 [Bdellovibrionales bacterium]